MAKMTFTVVGTEKAKLAMLHAGEDVRARLRRVVDSESRALLARTQSSFNQVLKSRSGKLFAAINVRKAENASWIGAYVGPSGRRGFIGRFFEKGYGNKVIKVRRTVKGLIDEEKGKKSKKLGSAGSFDRRLPWVQKPFLQPALDSMRAQVQSAFAKTIEETKVSV